MANTVVVAAAVVAVATVVEISVAAGTDLVLFLTIVC